MSTTSVRVGASRERRDRLPAPGRCRTRSPASGRSRTRRRAHARWPRIRTPPPVLQPCARTHAPSHRGPAMPGSSPRAVRPNPSTPNRRRVNRHGTPLDRERRSPPPRWPGRAGASAPCRARTRGRRHRPRARLRGVVRRLADDDVPVHIHGAQGFDVQVDRLERVGRDNRPSGPGKGMAPITTRAPRRASCRVVATSPT